MKSLRLTLVFITIISCGYAEDVDDILNQIDSEKEVKKQPVNSTRIQLEKTAEPKKSAPKPEKKKVESRPATKPATTPEKQLITVYRPKDKLPKDIAGAAVAGDFLLMGEDGLGGASLISVQDALNPLPRVFIVKNLSSGYAPGTIIPIERRRSIHIPSQKPLIFIGRDIIPGSYQVRAQ